VSGLVAWKLAAFAEGEKAFAEGEKAVAEKAVAEKAMVAEPGAE